MAILKHISWTGTGQIVRQSSQFALGIALARLLEPADFGLLALVTVFTGFARLFSDFGMSSAVIYKRDVSATELSFAFWLNIIVGLLVTGLCFGTAPLIASFYREPRVIPLMRIVALSFIITGFGALPGSLLQKNFRFRALAFVDISTTTVAGTVAVIMAFLGYGVWSLVAQTLVAALLSAIIKWTLIPWRPRFEFVWRDGAALWRFGANLVGFNIANYWCRNGDNLLIGRFCGAVELGLYSRAYSLMLLPVTQVGTVLSSVMFPTLAAMQNSKTSLRNTYLLACQSIAVFAFPVMVGLMIQADDFIYVLWGSRWTGVVPLIRVLAFAGIGNAVYTTVGWIYTSTGRTDLMFRWMLLSMPVMVLSYVAGLPWGAYGVAISYTIAFYLVLWPSAWIIAGRLIDLPFSEVMRNLAAPFAASTLSGISILLVRMLLVSMGMQGVFRLFLGSTVGASVYIAALVGLKVHVIDEMWRRVGRDSPG